PRAAQSPTFDDDFGIAGGIEAGTFVLQFPAQFLVIVYFSVEDDPDAAVGAPHRLMAGGKIDDRQPAVPEPNTIGMPYPGKNFEALVIGAAMGDGCRQSRQLRFAERPVKPGNAAHPPSLAARFAPRRPAPPC